MAIKKKELAWDDTSWIFLGAKVRYTGFECGEWKNPDKSDKKTLKSGMTGTVVEFTKGYPTHRCPDHDASPDCVCGGADGQVQASEKAAVVAWDAEGGTYRRLIHRDGKHWELVK